MTKHCKFIFFLKRQSLLLLADMIIIGQIIIFVCSWFGIGIMRYQIMQSERLLKESLRQDFASCGVITNVITPRNSRGGPCCDNTNFIYFDGEEAVNKALKLGPSLGLIVHALPKMTENSYSTMVLRKCSWFFFISKLYIFFLWSQCILFVFIVAAHCVQIANGIRKRQMEGNLSLSGLMEDWSVIVQCNLFSLFVFMFCLWTCFIASFDG